VARRWLKALGVAAATLALLTASRILYGATRASPCDHTEVTASIGEGGAPKGPGPDRLTIVLVGDTGFNPTDAPVDAKGIHKGRQVTSFPDTLAAISRDVDGDLAFANIETVVTDRNDLVPESKGKDAPFHFRSHPMALKAMMDAGFNLFALANNHSMDYGGQGVEETLYHFAIANIERPIAFAGIGSNSEEATKPACLDLDGMHIGFAATGIITGDNPQYRAAPNRPGQASYRDRPDFEAVVKQLTEMPADYRILSIHYGLERRVVPDERQLADWRAFAAEEKGILGHHPHVVQGVELNGKSLIFYGLGNFLHPGTAEMTRFGMCRDYGLMAKVYLARVDGAWRVETIEAIPLTNTQLKPERFASAEAEKRVYALNHLAAGLDDGKSAKGVRFTPQADGSGLYCADDAANFGGKIASLCQGWQHAAEPKKALADRIADACEDKPNDRPAMVKRRAPAAGRREPPPFPFSAVPGLRQF
jgi:poly-gamma-glutamate capsule biosynthesis protein CapA/YwtB (metallophosphatase superfamily)